MFVQIFRLLICETSLVDHIVRVKPAALAQLYCCIYVYFYVELLQLRKGYYMTQDSDSFWFSHVRNFCCRKYDVLECNHPTVRCKSATWCSHGIADMMCQEIEGRVVKGLTPSKTESDLMIKIVFEYYCVKSLSST